MNNDLVRRIDVYSFAKDQLEKETGAFSKGRNAGLRAMMAAAKNPDAIPTVNMPNWISVSEKLPMEMETVIVTDGKEVGFCFCVNDYGTLEFYSPWKITHWMPMPEPPKEES